MNESDARNTTSLSWWLPIQVLITNYCVCERVLCELLRKIFDTTIHLGNNAINFHLLHYTFYTSFCSLKWCLTAQSTQIDDTVPGCLGWEIGSRG